MKYYVGVGPFKVIQFNPDKKWLEGLGLKIKSEPVYVEKDKFKVVVAMQSVDFGVVTFATFELKDSVIISKTGKRCFINGSGNIMWATSENELSSIFLSKGEAFSAKEGEPFLFEMLKIMKDDDQDLTNLVRDKWTDGDFSELNRLLRGDTKDVGASVVVETLMDGKIRNKVYTKKFIPAEQCVEFHGNVFGKSYISKLIQRDRDNKNPTITAKKYFSDWEKLLLMMNDGFYPCQDFFYNGYIKPYVDEENLVAGNSLLIK